MKQLEQIIQRMDGKGYKGYKDIKGSYHGNGFQLHIDHVQADPFASPSRIRVTLPNKQANLLREWYQTPWRHTALEDFLAREVSKAIRNQDKKSRGTGKSGLIVMDTPGQEVLLRTSIRVNDQIVDVRLSVGLPAAGRRILGRQAIQMLCEQAPRIVEEGILKYNRMDLEKHLQLADQQEAIRIFLREHGYVAFVANGSILPRESGISNRPMQGKAVIPFHAPPSMEIEIPIPHGEPIRGMGIRKGVTLIVGGGYHGKSTLLKAMERGVYNHVRGDGREYVITDETAFKIRAEDGRRVEKVNISPFISNLPFGKNTMRFSTEDASGSTSQATNIIETLEMKSQVLLIDEDTSATNFMIRDARMQQLVAKGKEPITPFVDKVRQLYEEYSVSTILVIGGSGDYFNVADSVVMMDEYRPVDVTKAAKNIVRQFVNERQTEGGEHFGQMTSRIVSPNSFDASRGRREKVDAKGLTKILYGTHEIDLSYVEQLVDPSQTRAMATMIKYMAEHYADGRTTLSDMLERLYQLIEQKGLDIVSPFYGSHPGDMALPRKMELAAAINRLRTLKVKG